MNKLIFTKKNIGIVWLVLIICIFLKLFTSGTPFSEYPKLIAENINRFGILAPVIFIILFAIRPFIFFPATILSLSAGFLFGTYKAIFILLIAENLSAFVAYNLGKYFGKGFVNKMDKENKIMSKIEKYFQNNDFISILSLRLVFAPFDLVGYLAGASSINYSAFALATFIGIIPGLLMSAFLGGSINNPYYIAVALLFLLIALSLSKFTSRKFTHYGDKKKSL